MGRHEDALVEKLLQTTPRYKRDVMEQTIRHLLGAQQLLAVSGIPKRRGKADGGIDGVLAVSCCINQDWVLARAALNVKVRKTDFTREQFGGFLLDMDRENIRVGIIITAANLTPDAQSEMDRKNAQGLLKLVHIRLADILGGNIVATDILINGRNIATVLAGNLQVLLAAEGQCAS
jgi:predicted helicase